MRTDAYTTDYQVVADYAREYYLYFETVILSAKFRDLYCSVISTCTLFGNPLRAILDLVKKL
jgi:hypothetical protein